MFEISKSVVFKSLAEENIHEFHEMKRIHVICKSLNKHWYESMMFKCLKKYYHAKFRDLKSLKLWRSKRGNPKFLKWEHWILVARCPDKGSGPLLVLVLVLVASGVKNMWYPNHLLKSQKPCDDERHFTQRFQAFNRQVFYNKAELPCYLIIWPVSNILMRIVTQKLLWTTRNFLIKGNSTD